MFAQVEIYDKPRVGSSVKWDHRLRLPGGIVDTVSVCRFTGVITSLVCYASHNTDAGGMDFTLIDGARNAGCCWTWLAGVANRSGHFIMGLVVSSFHM